MLYALTFIVTLTTIACYLGWGEHVLIAMAVTMLAYHFLRPVPCLSRVFAFALLNSSLSNSAYQRKSQLRMQLA